MKRTNEWQAANTPPYNPKPQNRPETQASGPEQCHTHLQRILELLLLEQHRRPALRCGVRVGGGAVLPHRHRAVAAARGQQLLLRPAGRQGPDLRWEGRMGEWAGQCVVAGGCSRSRAQQAGAGVCAAERRQVLADAGGCRQVQGGGGGAAQSCCLLMACGADR